MDQAIFHLINERWTNPAFDLFMAAISNSEIWKPLIILAALAVLIFGGFKGRAFLLCLLLTLVLNEQLTNFLKKTIDRHRPKQVQPVRMVVLQKAQPAFLTLFKRPDIRYSDATDRNRSGPSFPSGHMTDNTTIAVCCTAFFRKRGWIYWIMAAAIGYSRIYLGAHWPSDILGTLLLATGETLLVLAAFEALWRTLGPRWASKLYQRHPTLLLPKS
jgi:undecaprenyl-diphosphatase